MCSDWLGPVSGSAGASYYGYGGTADSRMVAALFALPQQRAGDSVADPSPADAAAVAASPPTDSPDSAGSGAATASPAFYALLLRVPQPRASAGGQSSANGRTWGTQRGGAGGLRINQNIAAMNAYRNLAIADNDSTRSLERLSSGFRINRAADDAAGLSVSENLRAQAHGLRMAVRNAQDGVSVVQVAEAALAEMHSLLQRMRSLAVQAASTGSRDSSARAAAQTELAALRTEIDRISDTTTFGGRKLLDGTFGLTPATGTGLNASGVFTTADTDEFSIDVAATGAVIVSLTQAQTAVTGPQFAAYLQASIRSALAGGTPAQAAFTERISVTAANASGTMITITGNLAPGQRIVLADVTQTPLASNAPGLVGTSTEATDDGGRFQVDAIGLEFGQIDIQIPDTDATAMSIDTLDLTADAGQAITALDGAVGTVAAHRSTLGALQNRFEHAISNLNVAVENLSLSESRIRDTDVAQEMARFARSQILSQAGSAVLGQANQGAKAILHLLRG